MHYQIKVCLDDLQQAIATDDNIQQLIKLVQQGFPAAKHRLLPILHSNWDVCLSLSVDGDAILFGACLAIPAHMRHVLARLHANLQGMERMKARAQQLVYWPQ